MVAIKAVHWWAAARPRLGCLSSAELAAAGGLLPLRTSTLLAGSCCNSMQASGTCQCRGILCRCVTALKQGALSTSPSMCSGMQADVRKGPAPGSSCSGERSARDTSSWLLRVVLALHQAQLKHTSRR